MADELSNSSELFFIEADGMLGELGLSSGSRLLYLEFDNSHIILLKRWDGLIGEIWIEINDEGSFS